MYQRSLAKQTADHLRTHIKAYLDEVNAWETLPVTLVVPQKVEPASMAGGVFAAPIDQLPFYGVDCIQKQHTPKPDNLWCYEYTGHLVGLVTAANRTDVDHIVKGHASAVELYIRRHTLLHQLQTNQYMLLEFGFIAGNFSGAEREVVDDDREVWLAGFQLNVYWQTSEDGPGQH